MTTSGRDARRSPEAIAPAGSSGSAGRPRTSSPDNKSAVRLLGLAALIHMLRSRRSYERVVVGAIAVAALRALGAKPNGTPGALPSAQANGQQTNGD